MLVGLLEPDGAVVPLFLLSVLFVSAGAGVLFGSGKGEVLIRGLKVGLAGFIPVPGVSVAGFGRTITESDVVEDPIPGVLLGVFP